MKKCLWPFMKMGIQAVFLLLITLFSFSQTRVITGKVTGIDKLPLPHVSVEVKGTQTGTVTDAEGNFSLSVPSGAVLVFSSVGMETQEIRTGNNAAINIVLKPGNNDLGEVVVVGYGVQKKS